MISSLIDPRTSALRGVPREVRDLTAAARNSWLVCFDNLSRLPEDLADAACRLATGGGFGGRELYSDHDEAVFDATRPLVLNAIPDLGAARPDFLDRALIVEFNRVSSPSNAAMSGGSGANSQSSCGLASWVRCLSLRWPRVGNRRLYGLERLPRMADFATWATACEEALGLKNGELV